MPVISIPGTPLRERRDRNRNNNINNNLGSGIGLDLDPEPSSEVIRELRCKVFDSMSFACGGWLQFYMFGVAKSLQDHNLDQEIKKLAGCSAGALTAVGIALEGDFDLAIDICKKECVPRCYDHWAGWGLFGIGEYAEHTMTQTCNIHRWDELEDRLELAITRLPFFEAERVKKFYSAQDLKDALLASASCYPFAPLIYRRGSWCMDGGMSDFQPIIDENTITVSPFYFSSADIKPSRYVPLWWSFFPPKDEDTIEWLYHLGQEDMARFIAAVDDTLIELEKSTTATTSTSTITTTITTDSSSNSGNDSSSSIITPTDDTTNNHNYTTIMSDDDSSGIESINLRRSLSHSDMTKNTRRPDPHAYDVRRKVSIHRFLGFRPQSFVHDYVVFLGDACLLILLILFWKPFALILIYLELMLKIIIYLSLGVARETLHLLPMLLLCVVLCGPHFTLVWALSLVLLFQKIITVGPAHVFKTERQRGELYDCFLCLCSLSLAGRFISGGLSVTEVEQNDRLVQTSLVYRIVRYII